MQQGNRRRRPTELILRLAFVVALVGLVTPPHDAVGEPSATRHRAARAPTVSQDLGRAVVAPWASSGEELQRTSERSKWTKTFAAAVDGIRFGALLIAFVLGVGVLGGRHRSDLLTAASRGPPSLRTT